MSTLSIIRDKKQHLSRQIERAEETIARLRAQFADFETAERVLIALGDSPEEEEETIAHTTNGAAQSHAAKCRKKPTGLPAISAMIMQALEKAKEDGHAGLAPNELLSFVQEHYWQDAQPSDVGSTAWRMWKAERLVKPDKKSSIYSLPSAKQNAARPANASQATISGVV
ncbi:MAG: hypothetical protein WCC90_11850 [Methylocella sp.]